MCVFLFFGVFLVLRQYIEKYRTDPQVSSPTPWQVPRRQCKGSEEVNGGPGFLAKKTAKTTSWYSQALEVLDKLWAGHLPFNMGHFPPFHVLSHICFSTG